MYGYIRAFFLIGYGINWLNKSIAGQGKSLCPSLKITKEGKPASEPTPLSFFACRSGIFVLWTSQNCWSGNNHWKAIKAIEQAGQINATNAEWKWGFYSDPLSCPPICLKPVATWIIAKPILPLPNRYLRRHFRCRPIRFWVKKMFTI